MILKFKKRQKALQKPEIKLPHLALTDFDLVKYIKSMKIPYLRGVLIRNALPIFMQLVEIEKFVLSIKISI